MRFRTLAGVALSTGAVVLTACGTPSHSGQTAFSSQSPQQTTGMAQGMTNIRMGTFSGLNDKHVSGAVKITGDQVVLSGFSSDPGPDLHIYLTNGTGESAVTAGAALGKVAFDNASQTFPIAGVDASKYTTVVINCDKAKAVFGAAALA